MQTSHQRHRAAMHGVMVAAAMVTGLLVTPAFASTGPGAGEDRVAAVQTVLDRVLGPGNSFVTISDTVQTSTSETRSVQWGTAVPTTVAAERLLVAAGGSAGASSVQNSVGDTVTTTVTPAGALLRQSVSVVIDKTSLGVNSISAVRRLVAAASGVVPSRGDRLSIVLATFARSRAVGSPAATPWSSLLANGPGLVWGGGVLLMVMLIVVMMRGHRPRAATRGA